MEQVQQFQQAYRRLRDEIGKVIVGNEEVIHGVLTCIFVGGHALLEGVPGLGKTLLVRTLSDVLALDFKRVQFTPDLMPADVIGTNVISEGAHGQREFRFQQGPLFAQIVLADEINRATPKTQSALLEAMQERSVTVGGTVHQLQKPYFVLATQNPIEQEGTYPLPEAQLDRFFFKLLVNYATREELTVILDRTTKNENPTVERVMDAEEVLRWQQLVREVLVAPQVQDYVIRLTLATHPEGEFAHGSTNQYVRCGASPRGAQALLLASKVRALVDGRVNVSFEDVRASYLPAMRHRILLNFEAQAENLASDIILAELMEKTPESVGSA